MPFDSAGPVSKGEILEGRLVCERLPAIVPPVHEATMPRAVFRGHPSRPGAGVEHNLEPLAADLDWSMVILRLGEVAQRNRRAPLELQVDRLRGLRIPEALQTSSQTLRIGFRLCPLEGYPNPRASACGDHSGQPKEQRLRHCQRQPALELLEPTWLRSNTILGPTTFKYCWYVKHR